MDLLIKRLENATEADLPEIESIIHDMMPEPKVVQPPRYCRSLDAALTLRPDGANCHGYDFDPVNGVTAYWSRNNVSDHSHWIREGHHKTSVPIALVIACLKAQG